MKKKSNKSNQSFLHLKIGDRLLPIAAEEESQFPTLQEVAEMSSQQIKLAHINRELPKVDNPTWKADSEDISSETEKVDEIAVNEIESKNEPIGTPLAKPKPSQSYIGSKIPEEFLVKAGLIGDNDEDESQVEPLYKLNADGCIRGIFLTTFSDFF